METWKDIPEYEGSYQVSDLGRVKSLTREVVRTTSVLTIPEKILKSPPGNHGYPVVNLCKNKKIKQRLVHTLVAEVFIGPCPEGQEVRHRDGVRTHCALSNLIYGTRLQNVQDAQEHGTHIKGSKVGNSKLVEEDVKEIRRRLAAGEGVTAIAKDYPVQYQQISAIRDGTRWAWLPE